MTAHDLLAAFDTLAEAPDGVKRLRELVLQLAVRGKLVPQDPNDEPASVLLETVTTELSWRIPERLAPPKLDPSVESLAGVRLIPAGWDEVRLVDVLQLINGKAYSQPELLSKGTPVIRIQNLNGGSSWYYSDLELPERQFCDFGDLLFAWSASFGPYIWTGERAIYHYHIWKLNLSTAIDKQFMFYALLNLTDAVKAQSHGLAMLHMTKARMERWPMLLPPLAEQHRIVARVDELMGLLDKLESARNAREATRAALRDAVLAALRNADTHDEVELAWQRIAENMDDLFTEPADVNPLRQAILQLAVRGKLVPQDPNDEPASVLLGRIAAEKATKKPARSSRSTNSPGDVASDDSPFEVPKSWEWCPLGELASSLDYGTSSKSALTGAIPVLRMGNLQNGRVDWTNLKFTSDLEEIEKYSLSPGAVLFNRTNSPELVGKTSIYRGERPAIFAGYLIRIELLGGVEGEFVNIVLNSPTSRDWCWSIRSDGVSQSNISASKLSTLLVPLAPRAEQHRIVAKVDALMALLDRLEARLVAQRELHQGFAAAAVHHLEG